jgi:co-chaperonin GroES (HSP10)
MKIQSAENKVVVKPKTKYISNFTDIMKISAIQNFATLHLEDLVNNCGEIISIPKSVSKDKTHNGFSTKDIRVGDTAIFSFSVIYDFIQRGEDLPPLYKNMISYKGNEYFSADITKIYGVIRDGQIIMVNGYVMATTFVDDKIVVAAVSKKIKGCKSSTVMHVGNPKETLKKIPIKQGDTIYFNPMIAQKYQINNKPFIIIQQHQILGKQSPVKSKK